MTIKARAACVALGYVLLVPAVSWAQSGIAGTVKDTTGGVLPGVAVEAASPVLIERVRTALTDTEGRYKLDDLRPGAYTVTFTLTGFGTVKRAGIQLPTGFTATVNAEMVVGALAETVTVSGEASTVDVRRVTSQKVFSPEVVAAVPSLRSAYQYARLAPAVTSLVLQNASSTNKDQLNIAAYGGRIDETIPMVDGVSAQNRAGGGANGSHFRPAQSYVQEVTFVLAGGAPDQIYGGVVMNIIPKEGGNKFKAEFYGDYSPSGLQGNNLTDTLRAQGASDINKIIRQWDVNPSAGGPIVRDKLWFFGGYRNALVNQTITGIYADVNNRDWVYTPDLSRPAENKTTDKSYNARLTWQASPKNKVSVFADHQPHATPNRGIDAGHAPEGTTDTPYPKNGVFAVTWKSPLSSHFLLENQGSYVTTRYIPSPVPGIRPGTVPALISETGMLIRASSTIGRNNTPYSDNQFHHFQYASSVSYVSGSHTFKAGVQYGRATTSAITFANPDIAVSLRNGVPFQLTQFATPFSSFSILRTLGVHAGDQWSIKRLTLTLGVRFDQIVGSSPAQHYDAVEFAPVRDFTAETNVPNFKDLGPRLGASYDLTGDSKTALKVSLGRYVNNVGVRRQQTFVSSVTRPLNNFAALTWTDSDGNFFPNCDLTNPRVNGACGQISNLNFGLSIPNSTTSDPDTLAGFGKRPYNWEGSVAIQREVSPQLSVTAEYHRRWYGNFTVTENQATTPADYDPYCITAPKDSRLPDGGGYQVCGLTNVTPSLNGVSRNRIRMADNFGKAFEHFNGVDLSFTARLPRGIFVSGGLANGRSEVSTCFVVNSAQDLFDCDIRPPFQTNVRLFGVLPLPWGIQLSPVYQKLPAAYGGSFNAGTSSNYVVTYLATNADILPSLKRNLAAGPGGTVSIVIVPPGQVFTDPSQQLDLRVSKRFTMGHSHLTGAADINNIFNGAAVQIANTTYSTGPTFLRPQNIQPARNVMLSALIDF